MTINLGTGMVRLRVVAAKAVDDARILAERKARRERLLEQARKNPKPPGWGFVLTWFRGRRTVVTL